MSNPEESACPEAKDGKHCRDWQRGRSCCNCGATTALSNEVVPLGWSSEDVGDRFLVCLDISVAAVRFKVGEDVEHIELDAIEDAARRLAATVDSMRAYLARHGRRTR